ISICRSTKQRSAPDGGLSVACLYDNNTNTLLEQAVMISERAFKAVGRPLPRKEDLRLITGKGRFTDDFTMPGQVWAAMVRSPHQAARMVSMDGSEALARPGVLGVFTGTDCARDGLKDIPHNPVPSTKFDVKLTGRNGGKVFIGSHTLLPTDKARHVGE